MTWTKLPDNYDLRTEIYQVGRAAAWLHTAALVFCARGLTDGNVPEGAVIALAMGADGFELAEKLVASGLWDKTDTGYYVVEYLVNNPSRESKLGKSVLRAEAGRQGGVKSGEVRRASSEAKTKQIASDLPSKSEANSPAKHEPRTPYSVTRDPVGRDPVTPPTPPASLTVVAPPGERPRLRAEENKQPRSARDDRWHELEGALAEGTDTNPQTKSERERHAAYVDQLWQLQPPVRGDLVLTVCARYRAEWPDVAHTNKAILDHWSRFSREDYTPSKKRKGKEEEPGGEEARATRLMHQRIAQQNGPPGTYEAQYTVRGDT